MDSGEVIARPKCRSSPATRAKARAHPEAEHLFITGGDRQVRARRTAMKRLSLFDLNPDQLEAVRRENGPS
jgi:hypothetical protein